MFYNYNIVCNKVPVYEDSSLIDLFDLESFNNLESFELYNDYNRLWGRNVKEVIRIDDCRVYLAELDYHKRRFGELKISYEKLGYKIDMVNFIKSFSRDEFLLYSTKNISLVLSSLKVSDFPSAYYQNGILLETIAKLNKVPHKWLVINDDKHDIGLFNLLPNSVKENCVVSMYSIDSIKNEVIQLVDENFFSFKYNSREYNFF